MRAEAGCGAGQCERRQGAGLLAESDVVRAVMEGSLAKADDVCGC